MIGAHLRIALAWGVLHAGGCASGCDAGGGSSHDARLSGGLHTIFDVSRDAFGLASPQLAGARIDAFFAGNSLFRNRWVTAPASAEGRDGLGPLFNATACSGCHVRDGRGAPPRGPRDPFLGLLLRISVSSPDGDAPVPHPAYGAQIQPHGVLDVPGEAAPRVRYTELPGAYADGTPYVLRRPSYDLEDPAYGELGPDLLLSPRVAPAVFGVGLLENIPATRLRQLADERDEDGDGISGRLNRVWDVRRQTVRVGRFGWKAKQPTVEQQVAGAFLGDMGITTPLFPVENATPAQAAAQRVQSGGAPELDQHKLDLVTLYMKALAVPARRDPSDPRVRRGQELFEEACAGCHTPRHVTETDPDFPELSSQMIFPYTDLLLHDMGPELADGRPDCDATGREWRTPPLWGLGLLERVNGHTYLLHDGRARDVAEAILWHGGEGANAREFFRTLPAPDRRALLAFLEDL